MAKRDGFDKSFQLRVNDDFLQMIDNWMKLRGHEWSRSEAIRTLVEIGTASSFQTKDETEKIMKNLEIFSIDNPDALNGFIDNYKESGKEFDARDRQNFYDLLRTTETTDRRLRLEYNDIADVRAHISAVRSGCIEILSRLDKKD